MWFCFKTQKLCRKITISCNCWNYWARLSTTGPCVSVFTRLPLFFSRLDPMGSGGLRETALRDRGSRVTSVMDVYFSLGQITCQRENGGHAFQHTFFNKYLWFLFNSVVGAASSLRPIEEFGHIPVLVCLYTVTNWIKMDRIDGIKVWQTDKQPCREQTVRG